MYGSNHSNSNQRSSASSSIRPTPGHGPPSVPLGIIDDKPLTTDYDDALEEQRSEALSYSRAQEMARERERNYPPDPPPGFCDAMLPQTREGRLTWTIILIVIVVGICIIGVVMTLSNRSNNVDKSGRQTPLPTLSPSLPPYTRGNDDALAMSPSGSPSSSSPTITRSPTGSPSAAGTLSPTTTDREQRYRTAADKFIADGISATDYLYPSDGNPTSQTIALSWLLDEDPLRLLATGSTSPYARVVQRYIALVLFFETGGSKWTVVDNWLTVEHECDWHGFQCSELTVPNVPVFPDSTIDVLNTTVQDRFVISIQLENNNLVGRLLDEVGFFLACTIIGLWNNAFLGTLPTTLGNIESLTKLWLDGNEFVGTIPTEYGTMGNLDDVTLYSNQLSGAIPSEIGGLTNLQRLWANGMSLGGTLPTEIGNCQALVHLYLDGNALSGNLPSELGKLSNLRDMRIFENQLVGALPTTIFSLTSLRIAYVDSNSFQGKIPREIGNLVSIEDFQAYSNRLTGEIPVEVAQLSTLTVLRLEGNDLTGTIPDLLGSGWRLLRVTLSGNRIGGTIPVSLLQSSALRRLQLDGNNFTGTLPTWLGSLTQLSSVNIQDNKFEGPIPQELGSLSQLEDLKLESNELTGTVPTDLCALEGLLVLTADCNGTAPEVVCQCCTSCPGR